MNDRYTWNDLLVDISKLSNEERNSPVAVAGENTPFTCDVKFSRVPRNIYWHEDFGDECVYEDELEDIKPEDCTLVAKKGMLYLDID